MSETKKKRSRALVKNPPVAKKITKKKKKKVRKSEVPDLVIQDITNFGSSDGGPMRTLVSQMIVGSRSVLTPSESSLVDQILNEPARGAFPSPPFEKIEINWRRKFVIVDGEKMTIKEAKRRGFISRDKNQINVGKKTVVNIF